MRVASMGMPYILLGLAIVAAEGAAGWTAAHDKEATLPTKSMHHVVAGVPTSRSWTTPSTPPQLSQAIHDVVLSGRRGAPLAPPQTLT